MLLTVEIQLISPILCNSLTPLTLSPQRAQYVNGLVELPSSVRRPLFRATASLVRDHYNRKQTVQSCLSPHCSLLSALSSLFSLLSSLFSHLYFLCSLLSILLSSALLSTCLSSHFSLLTSNFSLFLSFSPLLSSCFSLLKHLSRCWITLLFVSRILVGRSAVVPLQLPCRQLCG
jgi:hypothetical protein